MESFNSKFGARVTVYGWPVNDETGTKEPTVFLGFSSGGFTADSVFTPKEARELAVSLLRMAEKAEGGNERA